MESLGCSNRQVCQITGAGSLRFPACSVVWYYESEIRIATRWVIGCPRSDHGPSLRGN